MQKNHDIENIALARALGDILEDFDLIEKNLDQGEVPDMVPVQEKVSLLLQQTPQGAFKGKALERFEIMKRRLETMSQRCHDRMVEAKEDLFHKRRYAQMVRAYERQKKLGS